MRISELAARTGLRVSTIRYYEKAGLCPPVARGADGRRAFSGLDLDWFTLLASLRETGMPLGKMQSFATLYKNGDTTVPERKAMLLAHRQRLAERKAQLERCDTLLTQKLARYDDIMRDAT